MKLVKQIGYKLIIAMCIVMTFCSFIASTPVEASKVSTEFYYSGTTKGSYTVQKGFWEKLVDAFDSILDYILGLVTMGFRVVLVGWTALLEITLTWIFKGASGEEIDFSLVETNKLVNSDEFITLDAIFFNRVPLLDINVFNFKIRDDVTSTGAETEEHEAPMVIYTENKIIQGEKKNYLEVASPDYPGTPVTPTPYAPGLDPSLTDPEPEPEPEPELAPESDPELDPESDPESDSEPSTLDNSLVMILKKAIAGWYYTFRLISIMLMLVLLVYIGVKLAIQSSTTEKALYKRVLFDWLVGMIIVFSIHYIMIFIIQFNEILVNEIMDLRNGATGLEEYEYGLLERAEKPIENDELEMTVYEEVKTRAYDAKMTVGTTGMIMYMVLVYYAWKYAFIYLKRYLTVAVLVIIAPLVAVSYAFNKVNTGKTQIFSNWLKEFFFIVILQSIHALMYVVFVDTALKISLESVSGILLVFMLLNFMYKAEGIFRKIFDINGKLDVEKGGIKDAFNSLKGGLVAMGAGKFAMKFTKGVAKTSVKPLTMAGGYGFAKAMERKANNPKFKAKMEQNKKDGIERLEKIRKGSIALALQSKELDIDKLTEAVNSLKEQKGQVIKNEDGDAILVDDAYIAQEEEALNEIKEIANGNPQQYIKDYNAMTKKLDLMKQYVSRKWQDIMNPYHYVEKDENGKYHSIKTKRKYNTIGKKTDSVGMRLAERLNVDNLLGLDKNTKEEIKQQLDLIKSEMIGFTGILVGLPALVANPVVGAAFLYNGVKHSNQVYGYMGRNKNKDIKNFKLMPDGTYTLKRFEGHSKQEIANEAKRQGRQEARNYFWNKANRDRKMVNRVKERHPKIYAALKGTTKAAGIVTAGIALTKLHPVTLPIAGMIIPVRNSVSHASFRAHNTQKAAYRANAKLYEKQVKSGDAMLSYMADKYYELETEQQKEAINRHGEEFATAYLAIKNQEIDAIDNMNDSEIKRELEYENIEIQINADGTKQLSGSSENSIIDNAIIESAQKYGIMNIGEFDLSSSHMTQITKEIETKLRKLGLIAKGISISDIIQDLERKIKDRQAKLALEGTKPVEEKLADKAIIEVMQDKNTTNPSSVTEEAVMIKITQKYKDLIPGVVPTEETNATLESLEQKKVQNITSEVGQPKAKVNFDETAIRKTIQARKAILSDKARRPISTENSQQMREALKRKKTAELDTTILKRQEELESGASKLISDHVSNENGGVDFSRDGSIQVGQSSDKVLEMLNLQTKMHQDKLVLENIGGNSKNEKLKAYKRQLFDSDGSIRPNVWQDNDGSRKLNVPQSTRAESKVNNINYATTKIEDVLITLNNK